MVFSWQVRRRKHGCVERKRDGDRRTARSIVFFAALFQLPTDFVRTPKMNQPMQSNSERETALRRSFSFRLLRVILAVTGFGLLLATVPIFFPASVIHFLHQQLGLGEFPDAAIAFYLARSTSLLYAVHGALIFFVSFNLDRYWPLIRLIGYLHIVLGLTVFGIDLTAPMPLYWIIGEGLPVAALGLLILWLWNRSNSEVCHGSVGS